MGSLDGFKQREPPREKGCARRRVGAAGATGVGGVMAFRAQPRASVAVPEIIGALLALAVTPFDEDRFGTEPAQCFGSSDAFRRGLYGRAESQGRSLRTPTRSNRS